MGIVSTKDRVPGNYLIWEAEPIFTRHTSVVRIAANTTDIQAGTVMRYDTGNSVWVPIAASDTPTINTSGGPFTQAYGILFDTVKRNIADVTVDNDQDAVILKAGPAIVNREGILWPTGITAANQNAWEGALAYSGIKMI